MSDYVYNKIDVKEFVYGDTLKIRWMEGGSTGSLRLKNYTIYIR